MIRLTDEQWERIRDHFPEENIADGRPGRKPLPTRCVLEAVLWILNTGAQWHMLPQSYPNYKTVHRRFQTWCRAAVLRRLLTDVANELRDRGSLNEEECFIDATFVMAKGGGLEIGATKRGKGMKQTLNGESPDYFFFYHNGITALCEKLSFEPVARKLRLEGLGVVNGCQSVACTRFG